MLEIGTLHGVTVAWWASARPGVEFVSVDPFQAGSGTGAGDIGNWNANHRKNQYLWVGTIRTFARFKPGEIFDLAFVDGDHSEKATFLDLEFCRTLVKGGQPIIVNDYGRADVNWRLAGVTTAVDSFCEKRGYKFEIIARSTIVLRKK
jgi:predicted O-methyltransferase YrrM